MDIGIVAPHWVQQAFWVVLLLSSLFYVIRMCMPKTVRVAYARFDPTTQKQIRSGYYDWDNELGHFLCIYATCQAFGPIAIQLSAQLWAGTLGVGALFFCVLGLTWGPRRPQNEWWWDWPHVGMFASMALMYVAFSVGVLLWYLQVVFWVAMNIYYTYSLLVCYQETKDPTRRPRYHFFSIGATVAHLVMGVAMFIMVAFPLMLMPLYNIMPGMICYGR